MKYEITNRGFAIYNFDDTYCEGGCTIQESSSAEKPHIWLGANEIGLKKFVPYQGGWKDVELEQDRPFGIKHSANNRMHLDQETAASLIPLLQYFVEHGELPTPPKEGDQP